MSTPHFRTLNLVGRLCLLPMALWLGCAATVRAADSQPLPTAAATAPDTNSQEVLRAYLQLQELIHENELAFERSRKESQKAEELANQALDDRLRAIEQSLAQQRAKELEAMQSSNRVMLIVAGAFAGVGLLAMVLMAYFQWRTVNRLATLAAALPGAGAAVAALGAGDSQLLAAGPAEESSRRLLGALDQLDKRMHQLEHTAPPKALEAKAPDNGAAPKSNGSNGHSSPQEEPAPEAAHLQELLSQGQGLLNQDKAEEALGRFEQVLAQQPRHPEALLKKGVALERLRKLEEAIACYDRALEADSSLTIAHLYKGGLFNRMERFDEALACYEKALHTQEQKSGPVNS